jgi:hypothetical protein
MNEFGIGAHRNYLGACFPELLMLLCQSSKLGGSDKSEIGRIKEKDRPLAAFSQCLQIHLSEVAPLRFISFKLEIRDILPGPKTTTMFTHLRPPRFFLKYYH